MINKISDAVTLTITAGADIAAGEPVDLGNGLIGVAVSAIANGAQGVVELNGVFELTKKTAGTALAVGDVVTYDTKAVEKVTISTAAASLDVVSDFCGRVVEAAGTAATTVKVWINR